MPCDVVADGVGGERERRRTVDALGDLEQPVRGLAVEELAEERHAAAASSSRSAGAGGERGGEQCAARVFGGEAAGRLTGRRACARAAIGRGGERGSAGLAWVAGGWKVAEKIYLPVLSVLGRSDQVHVRVGSR